MPTQARCPTSIDKHSIHSKIRALDQRMTSWTRMTFPNRWFPVPSTKNAIHGIILVCIRKIDGEEIIICSPKIRKLIRLSSSEIRNSSRTLNIFVMTDAFLFGPLVAQMTSKTSMYSFIIPLLLLAVGKRSSTIFL